MNCAGNNIAIIFAGPLFLRDRLYTIGLRLYILIIRLLQTMVGEEISS